MRLETHGVPNKCLMNSPLVQRATGRKQLVGENCKAFGHSNAQKSTKCLVVLGLIEARHDALIS